MGLWLHVNFFALYFLMIVQSKDQAVRVEGSGRADLALTISRGSRFKAFRSKNLHLCY